MVDGSSTDGHFWQAGLGRSVIANENSNLIQEQKLRKPCNSAQENAPRLPLAKWLNLAWGVRHMSSSSGKRSQSSTSGHGWPWQARTGAQLSLTATHRLRHGWIKLKGDGTTGYTLKTKQQEKSCRKRRFYRSKRTCRDRRERWGSRGRPGPEGGSLSATGASSPPSVEPPHLPGCCDLKN